MAACFSGLVAGVLGLTNLSGFFLYLGTAASSALTTALLNCRGGQIGRYVPAAHGVTNPAAPGGAQGQVKAWKGWLALTGLGQENLLGFLLFWIGGYALIHGSSRVAHRRRGRGQEADEDAVYD